MVSDSLPRPGRPPGHGPRRHHGRTTCFPIGELAGTLISRSTTTGAPSGFDLRVGTQGTTLAGLTDALTAAACLAVQHGAPLPAITGQWQQTRFVAPGATDIPHTTSLTDYLARRLTLDHTPTPSPAPPADRR